MYGDCRTLSTTVKGIGASGKERVKANPELLLVSKGFALEKISRNKDFAKK